MALTLDNGTGLQTATPGSQPANTPSPFVFKEDISSLTAITVTLDDTDMPFGRPREVTAFQSGGKIDIAQGGIYNPGSDRVILQMMAVRENRLVVRGHFRDRIRAGAQKQTNNSPEPNHARYMRDLIERVKRRANKLKISWNGDERSGVLEETSFNEEGPHDIAYTLTFFIATPPTGSQEDTRNLAQPTPSIEDLRSQMAAAHAQQQADMLELATNAAAVAGLSNALGFVANAIDALGVLTTTIERQVLATPQQVAVAANNVNSSAQSVQTQIQAINDAGYEGIPPDQAMVNQNVDEYMRWWVWYSNTQVQLDQEMDAMRQIRLQAMQQVRKTTRLYRVLDGDTLESIALSQLGSKARASDLGTRQDRLVPGTYIRIPQAT